MAAAPGLIPLTLREILSVSWPIVLSRPSLTTSSLILLKNMASGPRSWLMTCHTPVGDILYVLAISLYD